MRDKTTAYFSLIEKHFSSGLTSRVFCEQNGIKQSTFSFWKSRYRAQNKAGLSLEPEAIEEQKGFAQLSVAEAQRASSITLQYPDGTRLIFESGRKEIGKGSGREE